MEIDVIIPLYKPGKELFTLLDKLGSQSVPDASGDPLKYR